MFYRFRKIIAGQKQGIEQKKYAIEQNVLNYTYMSNIFCMSSV